MANRFDPTDQARAAALRAFGDELAEGGSKLAANDLEETMLRTQDALAAGRLAASVMPDTLKQTLWEDLMHAQSVSPSPLTLPTIHAATGHVFTPSQSGSSPRHHPPPLVRAIIRWQPAVSLAVVIAFLVGLVGFAYQRGIWNDPDPTDPLDAASQVMYDGDDASTFPVVPAQCATNGPVQSDAQYMDMSVQDFPQPGYAPVEMVTPEVGERIQDTHLRFARCQYESMENYPYPSATPTTYSDMLSPLALSFFSDRARLAMLYPTLSASQQDEIDAQHCEAIDEILAGFPLPLNQPLDEALISSTVDNLPRVTTLAFAPSDVYQLPDGRFGAIMGSVSTAALIDPTTATQDDQLTFIAFVEQDGRYLIDEEILIYAGGAEQTANPYYPAACE